MQSEVDEPQQLTDHILPAAFSNLFSEEYTVKALKLRHRLLRPSLFSNQILS